MADKDVAQARFTIRRAGWGMSGKFGAECSEPSDEDRERLGFSPGSGGSVGLPCASTLLGYVLGEGSVVKVTVEVEEYVPPEPTALWIRQQRDEEVYAARRVARERGGSIREG